ARQCEQMIDTISSRKRSEVARDQLDRHVCFGISDASPQNALDQGCRTKNSARCPERELRSAALHLGYVLSRDLVERRSVHQYQLLHSLRPGGSEPESNISSDVYAHDNSARNAQRGHGGVQILRLR